MEVLSAKCKTGIGFWNVKAMHETGKLAQATTEMRRYNLQVFESVRAEGQVLADTKPSLERQFYIPEEITSAIRHQPSSSRKISRSACWTGSQSKAGS